MFEDVVALVLVDPLVIMLAKDELISGSVGI